ncbi:MAG: hypothetical protein ABI616_13020 [Pseudomonadota bacterium]
MRTQQGQSLVEFAGGSAVFLLLLLGGITLSGYQEVQRRGTSAARQLAFQSAAHFPQATHQESAQRLYAGHFDDVGLLDAVGRSRYVESDDIAQSLQIGAAPGIAADAAGLLLSLLEAGSALTGRKLELDAGGYVSGQVTAHLATQRWTPEPFRNLDLMLRQPYAILSDPWNSGSPRQVRDLASSLVPTQKLAELSNAWQALAVPLSLIEPTIGKLCLGLIEPDTVPEDRLGPRIHAVDTWRLCQ